MFYHHNESFYFYSTNSSFLSPRINNGEYDKKYTRKNISHNMHIFTIFISLFYLIKFNHMVILLSNPIFCFSKYSFKINLYNYLFNIILHANFSPLFIRHIIIFRLYSFSPTIFSF